MNLYIDYSEFELTCWNGKIVGYHRAKEND